VNGKGNIPSARTRGPVWRFVTSMLTIFGAIALFLGFFVMFGSESSSIGLGGDVSWTIAEVSDAWMYGLLIAGGVTLAGALYLALAGRKRVRVESSPLADVVLHAWIFAIVNAFVWVQDLALDDGLDYAYWVTVPWGIGLAAHLVTSLRSARTRPPDMPRRDVPGDHEVRELQHR
jgi:hypothetical protein